MWPSIKALLGPHEYDHDYMMTLEKQRELVSVNRPSGIAEDTSLPTSPMINASGCSDGRSNPGVPSIDHSEAFPDSPGDGEIDQFGVFRLVGKTARRYYQSYLHRMHKLHPFLDQQELERKVEVFIDCHCPRILSLATAESFALCRDFQINSEVARGFVQQDIDSIIILLVFALGAICDSEFPHFGPVSDPKIDCHLPSTSGRALSGAQQPTSSFHVPLQASNCLASSPMTEYRVSKSKALSTDMIPLSSDKC
jgi:hypothetical protein